MAEFCRVLNGEGVLYAATNGRAHLREIDLLLDHVSPGARWRAETDMGFALDDAAADLGKHFVRVEKFEYRDELRVTESEPLVAFIASTMHVDASLRQALEARISDQIADRGYYWIGKQAGLLVATGGHPATCG